MGTQSGTALLMALAAGLSMLLGTAVIFLTKRENEKMLSMALGFAAGIMICVAFMDMIPHAGEHFENAGTSLPSGLFTVIFVIIGVAVSMAAEHFTPGHHHSHGKDCHCGSEDRNRELLNVGLFSAIAMGLHNLPEGMAIYVSAMESGAVGMSITAAVIFHNIPAGAVISMPVYYATGSKLKAALYTLIAAMCQPLGALCAYFVMSGSTSDMILGGIFAIVAGIMIYITFEELVPSSREHGYEKQALLSTIFGILLMLTAGIFE